MGLGAWGTTQRLEWERATPVTRPKHAAGEDASGRTARLRLDLVEAGLRNESKAGGLSLACAQGREMSFMQHNSRLMAIANAAESLIAKSSQSHRTLNQHTLAI